MGKRNRTLPRELCLAGILLMICICMTAGNSQFLSMRNISNIISGNFEIGLVCISMTYVILTAGMDMSVGSIAGLSNMLVGILQ